MIKHSSKQTGSAFVAIIVILVIAIAGVLGFIFWNNFINKTTTKTNDAAIKTSSKTQANATTATKIDTSIHEVNIKMQSVTDISQLPSYTPDSFRLYIQKLLASNTTNQNTNCTPQYQISKISQVNIQGGIAPVDTAGQTCPGGAPDIWVFTPSGTWDQESLNGPVCKSKNGGIIYEEFEPQCFTSTETSSFTNNPNGSITSLNK